MNPKKLLVLGATGGTGRQTLSQAVEQGHDVTVFVRSPQKLTVSHDRVRVATGGVTEDGRALAESVRGQDVVISTLGVGTSLRKSRLDWTLVHPTILTDRPGAGQAPPCRRRQASCGEGRRR